LVALGGVGGRTRTGAEIESEASVVGGLAGVKIIPEGSGSIRGATMGETPRELGADTCRLGIKGRGAVEELRE